MERKAINRWRKMRKWIQHTKNIIFKSCPVEGDGWAIHKWNTGSMERLDMDETWIY